MSAMALYGQLTGRSKAEAIGMRNGTRSSFFARNRDAAELVKAGNRFYRHRPDRMVETATVLSVACVSPNEPFVRSCERRSFFCYMFLGMVLLIMIRRRSK